MNGKTLRTFVRCGLVAISTNAILNGWNAYLSVSIVTISMVIWGALGYYEGLNDAK